MPTYGYRCTSCENTFERVQKITDAALTECESCGGMLKKLIYPVGIQFVGSGFYVNDYSKSGGKSGGSNSESAAGSSSSSSTEAKPAEIKSDSSASSTPAAPTSTPTPSSSSSN